MEKQAETAGEKNKPETAKAPILKKPFRYLRELSVVIIGVAVTFIGSNWISNRKSQSDLERYLDAVKIELQDNLEVIREKTAYYERLGQLAHYLTSDLPENLSRDSVNRLNDPNGNFPLIGHNFTLSYKTSAFEMLKSSGTMHLIGNNDLFQHIMDCYAEMESIKQESDRYMSRKLDILYQIILKHQSFSIDLLDPEHREMFYFFAIYIDLDGLFGDCTRQIETTLHLL